MRASLCPVAMLPLLGALGLVACGNPGGSSTGSVSDASTTDASTTDASTTDASTTDASTTDASTTDAGTTDAGSGTDTSTGSGGDPCPGAGPVEIMQCVDPERFVADLEFIAEVRTPGSPHWQAVQDLCATRLSELGFEVTLDNYGTGVNVIGERAGSSEERVLVSAHYDHIPGCTGADDNASGVAAVLEIARVLAEVPSPRTLVIVCWDEEELGLVGSRDYATRASEAEEPIVGVFNLDMIAYKSDEPNSQVLPAGVELLFPEQFAAFEDNEARADFILWGSDDTMAPDGERFDTYAALVELPTLGGWLSDILKNAPALAELRRSDHAGFWEADIPAMTISDTADLRYPAYHCGDGLDDSLDRLDLEFATKVVRASAATVASALGL